MDGPKPEYSRLFKGQSELSTLVSILVKVRGIWLLEFMKLCVEPPLNVKSKMITSFKH